VQGHIVSTHFLRQDLAQQTTAAHLLDWAAARAAQAEAVDVYRNKEGRKTFRYRYLRQSYFVKLHGGVGWREIIKNLLQLRLPVLGASNEFHAVNALSSAGVDTLSVAAYISAGFNPATLQSVLVTDDLAGTLSLEDYCADWLNHPPDSSTRIRLLIKLADTARRMHAMGINHRDFYLCHFHLDVDSLTQQHIRCYLIDLHRAQRRARVPLRWQVKDLAGLYFSAMDCGLTRKDLLRFMHHYCDGGLHEALGRRLGLWRKVATTARKLYIKDHGIEPPPLAGSGWLK
jgi:heptose I phosphotransferase